MKQGNLIKKIFKTRSAYLLAKDHDLPIDSYLAYATGYRKYVTIQDVKWLITMLKLFRRING